MANFKGHTLPAPAERDLALTLQTRIRQVPREDIPEIVGRLVGMLVSAAMHRPEKPEPEQDRLLDVNEAASLLAITPKQLKRRSSKYTFTRKISRKMIKYSELGIARYLRRLK
jgi:hypothetical protein